jgi:hypothetical protein
MWPTSRLSRCMKGLLPLTQALCGLMAIGVTVAEDTFIVVDIGRGQGSAAPMYAVPGNIARAGTGGIEEDGDRPPSPLGNF